MVAIPAALGLIIAFIMLQNTSSTVAQTVADSATAYIVTKAKSALNQGITYKLGHNNNTWTGDLPTTDGTCDCVQFVTWACGVTGVYVTTWIHDDAIGAQTKFRQIDTPVQSLATRQQEQAVTVVMQQFCWTRILGR